MKEECEHDDDAVSVLSRFIDDHPMNDKWEEISMVLQWQLHNYNFMKIKQSDLWPWSW